MSILNELNYEDTTLPNGLKVLTVSSPHLGLFSAELIIKKGFRDELEHQTQWTHLLEHVLASSSKLFPDQIVQDEYLTNKGISTNAYTDLETMAVWGESTPEQAPALLEYVFDAIKNPIISEVNIDREAEIINQEHRQKFINHDSIVHHTIYQSMVSGTTLNNRLGPDFYWLKKPTVAELQAFHKNLLNGQDIVLIISSSLSHQKIIDLVTPLAMDIPQKAVESRLVEVLHPVKLPIPAGVTESKIVSIKWLGMKADDPLLPALEIYDSYLTGTVSSSLNKKLRLEHRLTYGVSSGWYAVSDVGLFSISFKSSKPQAGLDLVREVIAGAKTELKSTDLQEVIKNRIILGDRRRILASPNNLINFIGGHYVRTGKIKTVADYEKKTEEVTADQLEAVLDKFSFDQAFIFSDDPSVK